MTFFQFLNSDYSAKNLLNKEMQFAKTTMRCIRTTKLMSQTSDVFIMCVSIFVQSLFSIASLEWIHFDKKNLKLMTSTKISDILEMEMHL